MNAKHTPDGYRPIRVALAEQRAKERLNATAPEMYATFRRLASFAEAHCVDNMRDSGLSALVAAARAIVAKVEGATECNPQPKPNP